MRTVITTWQIDDSKLTKISTTMPEEGRLERELEQWIMDNPEIIGTDVMIIGHQVRTDSGPIDLLGIDSSGNTIIIELKRGLLPRDVIAQAIDYAANVAEWKDESKAKLNDECKNLMKKDIDTAFSDRFPKVDQDIIYNSAQRIILVGFAIETRLERMIEWLSDSYDVDINAVILN